MSLAAEKERLHMARCFLALVFLTTLYACSTPNDAGNSPRHAVEPRGNGADAKATAAPAAEEAYDFVTHAAACEEAEASEPIPAHLQCARDSECGVCHDGSSCGTIMRYDEILRRGDECKKADSDACELFGVHCCAGRCVTTAVSGTCSKGSYWVPGKCD